jgi:hypothetical protein
MYYKDTAAAISQFPLTGSAVDDVAFRSTAREFGGWLLYEYIHAWIGAADHSKRNFPVYPRSLLLEKNSLYRSLTSRVPAYVFRHRLVVEGLSEKYMQQVPLGLVLNPSESYEALFVGLCAAGHGPEYDLEGKPSARSLTALMLASFPSHIGMFVGAVVDAVTAIQSVLPGYVLHSECLTRSTARPRETHDAEPSPFAKYARNPVNEADTFRPMAALGMAVGGFAGNTDGLGGLGGVGLGGTGGFLGAGGCGVFGPDMAAREPKPHDKSSSTQPSAADPFIDTRVFGTRESMVQRFGEKAVRGREQAFEQGLRAGAVSNAFYGTREDMVRDLGEEEVCRREADVSRCLAAAPGYFGPPKHFTREEDPDLARAIAAHRRWRAAASQSGTDDDRCGQPPDHRLEELCAPLPCVSNRCLGDYARGADFAPSGTVSQTLISTIADSLTRCADGGPLVPPLPPMPRLTARRPPTPLTYAEGLTTDPLVADMPQQPPIHDPVDHSLYTRRMARMPHSDE